MKTACVFQHVPFEGPGALASRLFSFGLEVQTLCWWEDPTPPDLDSIDLLIVLGGPMSVNDQADYPWIETEIAYVKQALHRGIPTLGICLGAQLMATALGASVGPHVQKEIGWWPLQAQTPDGTDGLTVLHWHGERFDLPEGATHLYASSACDSQAFRWGDRALGLQFHVEATEASLDELISHCRHELVPEEYVQEEARIREGWHRYHRQAYAELDRWLAVLTA